MNSTKKHTNYFGGNWLNASGGSDGVSAVIAAVGDITDAALSNAIAHDNLRLAAEIAKRQVAIGKSNLNVELYYRILLTKAQAANDAMARMSAQTALYNAWLKGVKEAEAFDRKLNTTPPPAIVKSQVTVVSNASPPPLAKKVITASVGFGILLVAGFGIKYLHTQFKNK